MTKKFASQGDMTEKKITFDEIGRDLWAFTAEGDPNSGVIFGEDSVPVKLPRHRVQDIGTPADWNRAEWLFRAMQAEGGLQ